MNRVVAYTIKCTLYGYMILPFSVNVWVNGVYLMMD